MKFDNEFREIKIRDLVLVYIIDGIILLPISLLMQIKSKGKISGASMNALCLLSLILVLFMLLFKLNISKEKINNLYKDFKDKFNRKEVVYILILLTFFNIGGANILTNIIYSIRPSLANDFIKQSPLTINSISDYFICFFILVILSPIVDELTFRNILFKKLSKKFNVYIGLIVSSIIFSAFNVYPEIVGILALGIINCILYVKYENILIPILIYAANSFINMVLAVSFGRFSNRDISMTFNNIIINVVVGLVLFTTGIIFFRKFIDENKVYLKKCYNLK